MIYRFDNINISVFGARASSRNGNPFALEGMFDLPKRLGVTEYDWGTSIEPFVDDEDIEMDGRTLTLTVVVHKNSLEVFKESCIECKNLSIDNDTFSVVQKDEIIVSDVGNYCILSVPFWQNDYELPNLTLMPSNTGEYQIDGFDFVRDLGIYVERNSNVYNTASRIDVDTTEFYSTNEYRGTRNIEIKCSMVGNNFQSLYERMKQFHAILMRDGLHSLSIGNKYFDVYFRDGLSVSISHETIVKFTLKARIVKKDKNAEAYLYVYPSLVSWIYPEHYSDISIESNTDWIVE